MASTKRPCVALSMMRLDLAIVLGRFPDGISPVAQTMAQITPPIGFNLFLLQGTTNHESTFIARAVIPIFLVMVLMVFVLILVPDIAIWLPNMRQAPG